MSEGKKGAEVDASGRGLERQVHAQTRMGLGLVTGWVLIWGLGFAFPGTQLLLFPLGAALGACAGAVFYINHYTRKALPGTAALAESYRALTRGELEHANERLASLEDGGFASIAAARAYQQALVRLSAGELEAALKVLTDLQVPPPHLFERMSIGNALGEIQAFADYLRVLLRQPTGGELRAPDSQTRASLAVWQHMSFLISARLSGQSAVLEEAFGPKITAVYSLVRPRERALLRVLDGEIAARSESAYRQPDPANERAPATQAYQRWLHEVLPEAVGKAPDEAEPPSSPFPSNRTALAYVPGKRGVSPLRPVAIIFGAIVAVVCLLGAHHVLVERGAGTAATLGSLTVALAVGVFGAVYGLKSMVSVRRGVVNTPGKRPAVSDVKATALKVLGGGISLAILAYFLRALPPVLVTLTLSGLAVVGVAGGLAVFIFRALKAQSAATDELGAVDMLISAGELEEAQARLGRYLESPRRMDNWAGRRRVSQIKGARGEFSEALELVDRLLAEIQDSPERLSAENQLVPSLLFDKIALAHLTGEPEQARQAFARLQEQHTDYLFLETARFRLSLFDALSHKDDGALTELLAKLPPDLNISYSEQLLLEMAVLGSGQGGPSAGALIQRLERELHRSDEKRHWVESAAPGVSERYRAAAAKVALT